MATYKLVNADQLDSDLAAIGDAIRSKGGTVEALSFPGEMESAIRAISTGVELNFKVVGGLTQPANPSENTIWVKTEKIGAWYFSVTQPEGMVDYDVWFPVGTSNAVEFNALKKNGIQVYPISAKQYIGGAWVDKTAKSYQGGAWNEWFAGKYLYNAGDECTDITGGWKTKGSVTISKEADKIVINGSAENAGLITTSHVDMTKFTTLRVEYELYLSGDSFGAQLLNTTGSVISTTWLNSTSKKIIKDIPIDGVSTAKLLFFFWGGTAEFTLYRCWME